jgi:phage baseplate assembly protein W
VSPINWSPTEAEEVRQNVSTILKTQKGSVPFSRDLGIEQDLIDAPVSVGAAQLVGEAVRQVRKYEPRAKLTPISVEADADGRLAVTTKLEGA